MRIDLNSFATIGAAQDSTPVQRGGAAQVESEPTEGVTAQLSPDSKVVSSLTAADDIRHNRVAALKQAIDNGTYKVDATGIAAAMMDGMQTVRFTL
jgi:flagellar biosynthesis anti-sigma factor FlgM